MTDAAAAWDAWEAEWFVREQKRVDSVRVRGYTLAQIERAKRAYEELERRVTLMLRARADAEKALAALRRELEHAEDMARAIVEGDPLELEELARALEALET